MLLTALCRAAVDHDDEEIQTRVASLFSATAELKAPHPNESNEANNSAVTSKIPLLDGEQHSATFSPDNVKTSYRDDYTSEELPHDLVRAAMIVGMCYCNRLAWESESADATNTDYNPIRMRCVLTNKQGNDNPHIGIRSAGYEIAHSKDHALHASNTRLNAKPMLLPMNGVPNA